MMRYEIPVPGHFRNDSALLDLETVKVSTEGFRMVNGENLARRWSIAMAGVALNGKIGILDSEGAEKEILGAIADEISTATEVVYGATRQFDEMIAKGRFTNARRAHEPVSFFPSVPYASSLPWRNVGIAGSGIRRGEDCHSRDVPDLIAYANDGDRKAWDKVAVHLLRDVCDLILVAGSPDLECEDWCWKILGFWSRARREIRTAGHGE